MAFWGLEVEPNKGYAQTVEEPFRLTNVAFGADVKGNKRCNLSVTVDGECFSICNLIPEKIEQQTVDLCFEEGQEITFQVAGENKIYLSGNYIVDDLPPMDMYGDEEDSEEDSEEEEEEDVEMVMDQESEGEEEVVDAGDRIKVIDEEEGEEASDAEEEVEGEDDKEEDEEEEEEEEPVMTKENNKRPAQQQQKNQKEVKKQKVDQEQPKKEAEKKPEPKKEEPAPAAEEDKENKIKKLPSGLVIEEKKAGTGARAKNGKKIYMRYIGKLTNGKTFDSNTTGKPFVFTLGKGEVIKGWDIGVQGMQVGGQRRLTIPPNLAYGAKGAPPDIPKNATLVFDVKLLDVK